MTKKSSLSRRNFLKTAAGAVGATQVPPLHALAQEQHAGGSLDRAVKYVDYPRRFRGRQLQMISFPLGGVAAGSIGLGGRGQLYNWEIFNRPNKGFRPAYAFPSIWAQSGNDKPVARILESHLLPPYEGQDGLGSNNAPGLSRLESATFVGEYPMAHIDFEDRTLPVKVALDAFSPFIPHDPDDSGLPVAILRYSVTNPGPQPAKVSIAISIENPVKAKQDSRDVAAQRNEEGRINQYRTATGMVGITMSNPALAAEDPMWGEFVLAATTESGADVSHWDGWPAGRWWNSPLLFWDQFSKAGIWARNRPRITPWVCSCLQKTIGAGKSETFQFLLSGAFPTARLNGAGGPRRRARKKQ